MDSGVTAARVTIALRYIGTRVTDKLSLPFFVTKEQFALAAVLC